MLNKAELENLKNWYFINPDYAFDIESIVKQTITSLGDDEDEITEFITSSDKYMLSFLALSADEISKKFTSDKMKEALKIINQSELE